LYNENFSYETIDISITQTLIREDEHLKKPFTIYVIQVSADGETWITQRKYKEFCSLNANLMKHFPNVKFPSSASHFANKSISDIARKKKTAVEDKRKVLQKYANK
jgi:hypothetical protein